MRSVRIEWQGPFCLDCVIDELNRKDDYGLYQIYGTHIILEPDGGADHLLYIGMTKLGSTFSERFKNHKARWIWYNLKHGGEISIHIARLPSMSKEEIELVEALEIYWHSPPYNGMNIDSYPKHPKLHIVNMGKRHKLLECIDNVYPPWELWSRDKPLPWERS